MYIPHPKVSIAWNIHSDSTAFSKSMKKGNLTLAIENTEASYEVVQNNPPGTHPYEKSKHKSPSAISYHSLSVIKVQSWQTRTEWVIGLITAH